MQNKTVINWAAFFGLMAVALGALGAHALKDSLSPESLESFKTAVRYQAWHAIVLFVLGSSGLHLKYRSAIAWFWVIGTCLFSGSILILSTTDLTGINASILGPVTPVGGLALMVGWFLLMLSALRIGKAE